jgi:hypothetical protein
MRDRYPEYCESCIRKTRESMVCVSAIGFGHVGFCDRCEEYGDLGSVRSRREHLISQMSRAEAECFERGWGKDNA